MELILFRSLQDMLNLTKVTSVPLCHGQLKSKIYTIDACLLSLT